MKYELHDNVLTLYFVGELNSYNAAEVDKDIEDTLKDKQFDELILNFAKLVYISSAGLRIILKLKQKYDNVSIVDVSLEVFDVLEMTGFSSIMDVKKALREIDVTGAEIVGEGFFSTVYRINKDTIIKVFNRTSDPEQIQRELKLAKEAFILGIPTAISFDIVKVGDKYGVCFEMLDCMSLKNVIVTYPEKLDEYTEKYANLLKKINSTECTNPSIPSIKAHYLQKLDAIKDLLDSSYYEKAKKLIEKIEDRNTFVHGDCHFKNIMVQNGELLLIDMDTLSVGHPIFELAQIYAPYCAFNEDEPGNSLRFFGIKDEDSVAFYNKVVNLYLGKDDPVIKEKIRLVCYIHMIWWTLVNQKENKTRIEGCRSRLYSLLDKYDDVNF